MFLIPNHLLWKKKPKESSSHFLAVISNVNLQWSDINTLPCILILELDLLTSLRRRVWQNQNWRLLSRSEDQDGLSTQHIQITCQIVKEWDPLGEIPIRMARKMLTNGSIQNCCCKLIIQWGTQSLNSLSVVVYYWLTVSNLGCFVLLDKYQPLHECSLGVFLAQDQARGMNSSSRLLRLGVVGERI